MFAESARPAEAELATTCELLQQLKDSGDDALQAARLHSATNARFVQALVQLTQYKISEASAEENMGRAVLAAIESRRALLAPTGDLEISHPLLAEATSGHDLGSEGLLRRLAQEAEAARARIEAASIAIRSDDLAKAHEDQWRDHAAARDQSRQDEVHLTELRLEGLRAKQRSIESALGSVGEDVPELPELPIASGRRQLPATGAAETRPLLQACADLTQCVHEMGELCSESRGKVKELAARIAQEHGGRRRKLQAALQTGAADVRATRRALEAATAVHERRTRAEVLVGSLATLQAEVTAARKDERKAKRALEDLEDDAAPGDPEVARATTKLTDAGVLVATLSRRRDGIMTEVAALSATPAALQGDRGVAEDEAIPLDFPRGGGGEGAAGGEGEAAHLFDRSVVALLELLDGGGGLEEGGAARVGEAARGEGRRGTGRVLCSEGAGSAACKGERG